MVFLTKFIILYFVKKLKKLEDYVKCRLHILKKIIERKTIDALK